MFKGGWTRHREKTFGPRRWAYVTKAYKKHDFAKDHPHEAAHGIYTQVQTELRNTIQRQKGRWRGYQDVQYLNTIIEATQREAVATNQAHVWLRSLILQSPRAVQAQRQMDAHPHGFRNKEQRTLELIDFNDAFVATILVLPKEELDRFSGEARLLMDWFCKRVGVGGFSNEQYEAIVKGLTREIAVFYGANANGLTARLTDKHADAMGIDVVITDPKTGKSINVDCKTPSSYRHRLGDLVHEGRMSEGEMLEADQLGYAVEWNGKGGERVQVVLLRIDREKFGEVINFEFERADELGGALRYLLQQFGT